MKKNFYSIILAALTSISVFGQTSKCIDLGAGVQLNTSEYGFIDFFWNNGNDFTAYKFNGTDIAPDIDRQWYRVNSLDEFKVVNGAYWNWDADWSQTVNNNQWNDGWADCFIRYNDMMVDQNAIISSGYPKSIPITLYKYKTKTQDPDQGPDSTQPITIGQYSRRIYLPTGIPVTGWVMKWKGKGRISFEGIDVTTCNTTYTGNSGSFVEFNSISGGRAEVVYTPYINGRVLNILESDASDPIRDIVFLYPGLESLYDGGQRIHPSFIEKMSIFKNLRYMEYNNANSIKGRTLVYEGHPYKYSNMLPYLRWDERTKADWYSGNNGNGGAHEYIVEAANLTKTDAWVNIPYCAGEDYVKNMVKYYMDNLSPDLTLHLELGNEIWNYGGGFFGFHWFANTRNYYYPGLGDSEGRGAAINDVFTWVKEAAGENNMSRIQRVYGAFPEYGDINNRTLLHVKPDNWDEFASTFYFSLSQDNSSSNTCRTPQGKTWREELYDYYTANQSNLDQNAFNQKYKECVLAEYHCSGSKARGSDVSIAKSYNKKLVCYEGGNSMFYGCTNGPDNDNKTLPGELNFNNPIYPDFITDNGFINAVALADESQATADIYVTILDSLRSAGFKLANHLSVAGTSSCYGLWSLYDSKDSDEDLAYLKAHYPKFNYFCNIIDNANCSKVYNTLATLTVGSGLSIKLDGFNDYIDLNNQGSKPNESADYTIENWIKSNYPDTLKHIFSLVNSAQTTNFNSLYVQSDGRVVWEVNSGVNNMKIFGIRINKDKWYHLAVTKSGTRYTLYINGKNVGSTNATLAAFSPDQFSMGAWKTNAENLNNWQGEIDEFRIWNTARTEDEIRDYMCKKFKTGSLPASLKGYYTFDIGNNSVTIPNLSDATGANLSNVTFSDHSNFVVSGAAIGDISKYRYESDWSGASVTSAHPDGDFVGVTNMGEGNPDGIQIYWVNAGAYYNDKPLYYESVGNNKYFGVFMANGNAPSYDITYMYEGNPQAGSGSAEDKNRLLKKDNAANEYWEHAGAQIDKVTKTLSIACKENERAEYNVGLRPDNRIVRPGPGKAISYVTPDADGNSAGTAQYFKEISDYTVSFWAKGFGSVFNMGRTIGDGGQDIVGIAWGWQPYFEIRVVNETIIDASTTNFGDSLTWYHYTLVRNGSNVTMYVNGNQVLTKDFPGSYGYKYNQLLLMQPPNWASEQNIQLDEFTLWDIPLDQKTIRDWMCKKITKDHPYACENLILYLNFDEGQGDILEDKNGVSDMQLTPGYFTYVNSGAAVGDQSVYNYTSPSAITMTHPEGDAVKATVTSGNPLGVHLYRVDHMGPVTANVNDPGILSMDSTRYWGIYTINPQYNNSNYDITYNYQGNSTINTESTLRLLQRKDNTAATWTNPAENVDNVLNKITINNQTRGEYVLGGTTPTTFVFTPPAMPVFMSVTGIRNKTAICGNSKGLIYKLEKNPAAVGYVWSVPSGIEGFSSADSIIINGEYAGSFPITVTLAGAAVNQFGKSPWAYYTITINPQPTKADAGPDQFIIPPVSSAIMDGNTTITGETVLWSLFTGTGILSSGNIPKATVTGLAADENVFVYTISQSSGICPSNSDTVKITVAPLPKGIVLANGQPLPEKICAGTTLAVKALPPDGFTPLTYQWVLPAGMSVVSQNVNTAQIAISTSGIGGKLQAKAVYNGTPSKAVTSSYLSLRAQPSVPFILTKPANLCYQIGTTLSIDPVAGIDSVDWQLPFGIYPIAFPKSTGNDIKVWPIITASGYIKARAYNDGCTNPLAIDSFWVDTKLAPKKPDVHLATDGGVGDIACSDDGLYTITNAEPNTEYTWSWGVGLTLKEYFGENKAAALFDLPVFPGALNADIYVYAKTNATECNTSETYHINVWQWDENGFTPDVITITSPVGQDLSNMQIGQEYTFQTLCSTCPTDADSYWRWQNNYWFAAPEGATVIPDGNPYDNIATIRIDSEVSGPLRAWAVTRAGCVNDASALLIKTPNGLEAPLYVSGTTQFCQGANFNISVTGVPNAAYYAWKLPNGTGTVITTTSPLFTGFAAMGMTGDLLVSAHNGTVSSTVTHIKVAVLSNTLVKPTFYDFNGNPTISLAVCEIDQSKRLFISDIHAREYDWAIPGTVLQFAPRYGDYDANGDGTIDASEQNYEMFRTTWRDTMIVYDQVNWRTNSVSYDGNFILTSKNGCGGTNRIDSLYYYYAQNAFRQIPVFVEAPTTLCRGSSATYRVNEIKDATEYIWSLPPGLTSKSIVTNIPQITVQVGSGSGGKVSVYVKSNVCGGGQTITQSTDNVTISGAPRDFKFLQAPTYGCVGQTLTYTVNDIGASKYTWNLPGGIKDVIADDSDPSTVLQGGWETPYSNPSLVNGSLRVTENNDPVNKKAIYTLNAPRNGMYKVYSSYYVEWYNVTVVKIIIDHVNGSDTVIVNQKQNPSNGIWQYLGEYEFTSTVPGKATVLTQSGGYKTMIDAFKLESEGVDGSTSMSFTVNGKESGSVCVTVPDAGCPSGYTICTENVDLSGKLNPPVFIATIPGICQGQAGVSFNVANDPSVDFYNWSYSGSGVTINGTSSGVFLDFASNATAGTLSVSGTNSCTQSKVATIVVNVSVSGSVPVFAMGNSSFRCQGAGSVGYVATNTGMTRYMVSPSSISINTITSAVTWNATFSGIATITAYSLGCSAAFARHVVTVNSVPSVSIIGVNSSIMLGASTGVLTVAGFSGSVINWQVNYNGGAYTNISTATGLSYSNVPNAIGLWNYRAVLNGGLCANITTSGKSIQVTGTPGTVTGSAGSVCINATVGPLTLLGTIGNVSGWEYSPDNGTSWSGIANTTTLLSAFGPLSVSGTYQFKASISGVGYSLAQSTIVNPLPVSGIINVAITTVCGSGITSSLLTLTGSTGTSIMWEMNTGTGWNIIGTAVTSYQVDNLKQTSTYRVQVGNGICANATTPSAVIVVQSVTTTPALSISYAKTLHCIETDSPDEAAIISISATGSSFTPIPSGLALYANGDINVHNSNPGTYQVVYRIPDGVCPDRGATVSGIVLKSKPVPASLGFLKTDYCNSDTPLATLDGVGGTFSSSITGLSIIPIPSTPMFRIVNAPKSGDLSITYILSVVGCSASVSTASTHISEETTLPDISYKTPVCLGTPITPTESITGHRLLFSSESLTLDNLGTANPTVTGTYTITYTLTGNGACSSQSSDPVIIEVKDNKAGTAVVETALNICEGNTATMNVAVDNNTYQWQQKIENTWKTTETVSNTFISDPLSSTSYFRAFTVPSQSDVCGKAYSNVLTVTTTQLPKPGTIDSTLYTFCDNLRGELKLNNYSGTILWQESGKAEGPFTDLKNNTTDVLPIQFSDYAQVKFVKAQITNTAICPATFTGVITVTSCKKSDYVPNALTPNSSDMNSKWDLSGLKLLDEADIKVFSRYGVEVYSASGKEVRENPWGGGNLAAGTYYYVIDRNDKKSKPQSGAVTIIK